MTLYKQQARRLRERLSAAGLQVTHSLALETIAAVHGAPNWDTLAAAQPTDPIAPRTAATAVTTPPASPGAWTVVIGEPGSGKTFIAQALAARYSAQGINVLMVPEGLAGGQLAERLAQVKTEVLAPASAPAALIIDDADLVESRLLAATGLSPELFMFALSAAAAAGASVTLTSRSVPTEILDRLPDHIRPRMIAAS